jgi:hypothetical protein
VCLETMLVARRVSVSERLTRARALRAALPGRKFRADDIDAFKAEGRR